MNKDENLQVSPAIAKPMLPAVFIWKREGSFLDQIKDIWRCYVDNNDYYSASVKVDTINSCSISIKGVLDDNNWYIEQGRERSFTISQKYIKDAEVNIPIKLYHITPTKYVDNILNNGLKPKSDDLRHKYPPRIYVSDNIETLKPLSKELTRWKGDKEYSILEINTNGLDFKLYKDTTSAYKGHYYIQDIENIPSENIKPIE